MFKLSKFFSGVLAVGVLAAMLGGGVTASAASGPGDANYNLSGNGTSVSDASPVFEVNGENPATAKSTAEFNIRSGKLVLVAVPDFNFGTVEGAKVLNGGSQKLIDNAVQPDGKSKNRSAYDGNTTGKLIIYDRRGTAGGWTLQLAMNPTFVPGLASENLTGNLTGLSLDVKGDATTTLNKPLHLNGIGIGATATQIVNATTDGAGDTEFNLHQSENATLNFPSGAVNTSYLADKPYQSDLTWTLTAGA